MEAPSYQSPVFGRLKALMDHLHSVGFVDAKSDRVEAFPYWLINEAVGI